ncbi:hypothetical protein ACFSCX_25020 [Bacillus salitolerans]|uniref:Uncharacterized protein n=1 Tax=Bacillus salitolerans TaxID=1437434 RepID=A0ABW4LY90_9BACI
MNIVVWSIVGIILFVLLIFGVGIWLFQKDVAKEDPEYILQFIKDKKELEQVSLSIHFNKEKWVEVNQNVMRVQ